MTLNSNEIGNVAPLAGHPSLVTVNLKDNAISDLSGLASLPRLKTLDLTLNDVISLATIGRNSTLYTLRVGQTASSGHARLTSLAGIERLTGLGVLNINHTAVTTLARSPVTRTDDPRRRECAAHRHRGTGQRGDPEQGAHLRQPPP
ncbi:leucine-rich repeat domain-containing protein [Tessaracoccus sp. HDW20]|uniref:leucine-rich repeat domain-containing protein n=1 Tax=Tessaracoccus coleopterorum TaxID=2714950 RepID=UPI0018D2FAAC|nr:leucine-rich repeat domain-containing protein [Tessaracoccus coleopterorum]NHB84500.1 leucine-rich repeat domain-containing protein [Tessaracoccus coleopterorum]